MVSNEEEQKRWTDVQSRLEFIIIMELRENIYLNDRCFVLFLFYFSCFYLCLFFIML